MQKTTFTLLATAVALSLVTTPARADDKQDREHLNKRIHEVNDTVKKRDMTKTALKHISVETGVPLAKVESMHKNYDVGASGVLMACVLADETKKAPEDFLRQREKGKDWAAIARDNNVALNKLSARLDRLEGNFPSENTARAADKTVKKNKR